jgi:hypothetical protein
MRLITLVLILTAACIAGQAKPGFREIWVLQRGGLPGPEHLLAATLQGLTADNKDARIWIREGGAYEIMLESMKKDGIQVREVKSVWELVDHFRPLIHGMIVCKIGTDSINVATSLCGPDNCVAVDESLLDKAKSEGLEVRADVRGMNDRTAFTKYRDLFAKGILVSQSPTIAGLLRDYAVARHAYTCGTDPAFVREAAQSLGPNALVYGWGMERDWVGAVSQANATAVPADLAANLSVTCGLPAGKLKRPREAEIKTEDNVRYIAFILSDGDNLQFFLGGYFGKKYWNSALRGKFPFTWEVPVAAAKDAPRALEYAYETATPNDGFVTGAGLPGYTYAHQQPDKEALAKQASDYLRLADLDTVGVINNNVGSMDEVFPLLDRPEVKGILYKDLWPYEGRNGAIVWRKGKPCLSFKFALRERDRQSPEKIAEEVAKMPASPKTDEASYALVTVLAWQDDPLGEVQRTIELLPKNTRVITANQMISMLRENFGAKHP